MAGSRFLVAAELDVSYSTRIFSSSSTSSLITSSDESPSPASEGHDSRSDVYPFSM